MQPQTHQALREIHEILQAMLGYYRQLWALVGRERDILVDYQVTPLRELLVEKETLLVGMNKLENDRQAWVRFISQQEGAAAEELTLKKLVILCQGIDPELARKLEGDFQSLSVMSKRIQEKNKSNEELVHESLEHLDVMKTNVLGERTEKSQTYNQRGKITSSLSAKDV